MNRNKNKISIPVIFSAPRIMTAKNIEKYRLILFFFSIN